MNDAPAPFDVAVIGGGPAGIAAAIALAQTGANTALVARRRQRARHDKQGRDRQILKQEHR